MIFMEKINLYMLILGTGLVAAGVAEMINPRKLYGCWNRWINHRLFFFHGIFLIILGFPLIFYKGYLSLVVFLFGCFALFTGPFIIIYPEKLRKFYSSLVSGMEGENIEKLVSYDGALRISAGTFLIYCYLKSLF
jgi:uncharacterized membrane protein HdeD (DUF308 family)